MKTLPQFWCRFPLGLLMGGCLALAGCQSGPQAHLHVPPGAAEVAMHGKSREVPRLVTELADGHGHTLLGIVSQASPSASPDAAAFEHEVRKQARARGATLVHLLEPEAIYDEPRPGRAAFGDQLTLYRAALYSDSEG